MNLNEFAEMYSKLEDKALKIMEVYGIGHYDLDGIGVEEYNDRIQFNINTSFYYSGCGTESESLTFDLEEMNNDIEYFKTKYKKEKELEKIKVEEEIQREIKRIRLLEEAKEIMEYQRLKKKFESDSK